LKGASVNPVVTMRDLVMKSLIKFENHMAATGRPVCAPSRAFLCRELADAGVADHSMAKQLDDRFLRKDRSRMLAIDGIYRITEDLKSTLRNRAIQAWLRHDVMFIAPLYKSH
jgi:hypothetical protein